MARSATQHPPNEGGNTGLRARRYSQSVLVLHLVRHGRSSAGLSADYILLFPVCTENLNPDVVAMKSAKDRV
jgi:hypothetical protein